MAYVCGTNNHVKSELLSNTQTDRQTDTQTHRPSTVILAAHARRGLITSERRTLLDSGQRTRCELFQYKIASK